MSKKKNKSRGKHPPAKKKIFKYSLSPTNISKSSNNSNLSKNPIITLIREDSHFVYDINEFENYFSKVKEKNKLKLNESELEFLKKLINNISSSKTSNKSSKTIEIPFNIFTKINNYVPNIKENDKATEYIKSLSENQKDRSFLSCRRIANKYFKDTGNTISKTKVHNILRNKLNLRFRKTTIKNSKVNNERNILISLCFIKILVKCLKLNYKIIYIDETSIQSNNNNFKTWRLSDETIFYNLTSSRKQNLIAAIDEQQVLYYNITEQNTSENTFLDFMEKLLEKIKEKNIGKYVIIFDNLSSHKTELLKEFYVKNGINVIFNSP